MSKKRRMKKLGLLVFDWFAGDLGRRRVSEQFIGRASRALRRYHRDTTEQDLRKAAKKIRPHNSFFKWTNKPTEEVGVVIDLMG